MKSVIQESTSLSKAIEEGWKKAGKPSEFSVKIYQEAEYNFLGLGTKQKAKICIFFEDRVEVPDKSKRDQRKFKYRDQRPGERRSLDQRSDDRRKDLKERPPRKTFNKKDRPFKKEVSTRQETRQENLEVPKDSKQHKTEDVSSKKIINAFVDREK